MVKVADVAGRSTAQPEPSLDFTVFRSTRKIARPEAASPA
jgi:hypothetical protein